MNGAQKEANLQTARPIQSQGAKNVQVRTASFKNYIFIKTRSGESNLENQVQEW